MQFQYYISCTQIKVFFSGLEVEGIECKERSIIPKKVLREKLEVVIESDFTKASMSAAMKALKGESQCCDAVCDMFDYLKTQTEIPDIYKSLIKELRKDSPITSWLPIFVQSDTVLFLEFLQNRNEIFNNLEKTAKLSHAFPYLARMVKQLLKVHDSKYLPSHD